MSEKNAAEFNPVTEGALDKEIIRFFLPLAGGSLIQQLYNMADAMIVGKIVGKEALAAVGGSAAIITMIIITIILGLTGGSAVVVSHKYGARHMDDVDTAIHTAMTFSLVLGLAVSVIGLLFGDAMLRMMRTPDSIFAMTSLYVKLYFIGIIPTSAFNMGSAVMRALGDSRRPFRYLIVCNVVNIVLDILLVIGMQKGIAGAAAATVMAQAISAVLVCKSLARDYEGIRLSAKRLRIDRKTLRAELRIGTPAAVMSFVYGITNVLIQADINVLGTDTVAAWAAFGKADLIFWTCSGAFGTVAATFAAQNFGAGNRERVLRSVRVTMRSAFIVCGFIMVILFCFGGFLLSLFTSDGEVISIGISMIRFFVPSYLLYIYIEVITGTLRGLGDVRIPTTATVISLFAVRIPWLLIYFPAHPSLKVLIFSYPLQWLLLMAFLIVYWMRRRKKTDLHI